MKITKIILFFAYILSAQILCSQQIYVNSIDYPPYESINETGTLEGYNVDIAKEIAKRLRLSTDIKRTDFVKLDSIDINNKIFVGTVRLGSIKKHLFYSNPFGYTDICYTQYGGNASYYSPESLKGKKVIYFTPELDKKFIAVNKYAAKIYKTSDLYIALIGLKEKKYDVLICSLEVITHAIHKYKLTNYQTQRTLMRSYRLAFVTNDSTIIPKLNTEIQKIRENGTCGKMYNKWFLNQDLGVPYDIVFWGIILFIAIIIALSIIYLLYKRTGSLLIRLKRENKKLNLIIEASNIKIWGYNLSENHVYNISGELFDNKLSLEENLSLHVHTNDRYKIISNFERILKGVKTEKAVIRFRENKDNPNWRTVCLEFAVLNNLSGEMTDIICSHSDVTQEIESKKALEAQRTKMELALKDGSSILWEYNVTSRKFISYTNPYQNYDKGIETDTSQYYNSCYDDDDKHKFNQMIELMNSGKDEHFNISLRLKNSDKVLYYSFSASPLEKDSIGKVTKYVGLRHDNSDIIRLREEVENYVAKINYIIVASHLLSYDYDITKKEITISSGKDDIITLSREEYIERVYFEDREHVSNFLTRLENKELGEFREDRRIMVPNSTAFRYVDLSGIPIKDNNGEIIAYSGFRRDVTELVESQKKLEEARAQAENADRLKTAFLANMSHEIRTPLNAIVGFSELLEETEDKDDRNEYISIINTNSDLLLQLINDILDLSKIEAQMVELYPSEFDFVSLFNNLKISLTQRCKNPNITIQSINKYSKCMVYLDQNRVSQIIMNYGTNAIKYTEKGFISMSFTPENGGLKIEISDTGIGISEEKQSRIFNRFEKLDNFAQGTGLGLSICKALAEAMHGEVGFTSKEGVGSTFWAFIPCNPKIEE